MKVEIYYPAIQIGLDGFSKVIPQDSHLRKLENLLPLKSDANRRLIIPDISSGAIMGYVIQDFSDRAYRGMEYFMIGRLASMPDPEPRKK